MSYRDLPEAALAIIADQGWNDTSINTIVEGFLQERVNSADEGFRSYCGNIAAEECNDAGLKTSSLTNIIMETGWDEDTMRTLMLQYGRGVMPTAEFDDLLVDYMQDAADEENGDDLEFEDEDEDEDEATAGPELR